MSNNLNKKLASIAQAAVSANQKKRDSRGSISKGIDIATNKSYTNEDKKVAAAAIRDWQNKNWTPKVEAKLKQELKARAPHLKPGTKDYKSTYDSLFNTNLKQLNNAKTRAYQGLGVLRKDKQSQRQLDNDYKQKEASRTDTVGVTSAAMTARDTAEAATGALATGASRTLRYPLQFAADIGENDDGGIFDRGAKALERHEDNLGKVYPAYTDIQQNGNFGQKLALSAVEQVPTLAASFGSAGAAAKGAQLLGAGTKVAAATSYGTAAATMYPQAYGDGNDSTKQELEDATPQMLANAERSQDIYKSHYNKNLKNGMNEDEAYAKARDQTISSIAEESGDSVGLATLALSMLAPGVGSFSANQVAGGAVSKWGQKVFNKLAVRADAGKIAKYAIPAAVGTGIVGLNVVEEGLQEGYTDYVAQQAAVDVGVKKKVDAEQLQESILMGGALGGLMGGSTYIGTRNSKLKQAQDSLTTAQQSYADIAAQIPELQQQIEAVSPRSPAGQALTSQLEDTKATLDAMAAEAEKSGIPRTSLARRAPRIEPTNNQEFDGDIEGSTELNVDEFENTINPQPATEQGQAQPTPINEPQLSEQELDVQDAQIAELIAEQQALDEAIEDGSGTKPVEQSIAEAQAWYDDKRGQNVQGLSGVVRRAAAAERDAAFEQQQGSIDIKAAINDYIAGQRNEQAIKDEILEQESRLSEKGVDDGVINQRNQEREQEDAALARRIELAQPYENESFDTTVIGADGVPFNLARFWDDNMPAGMKAKAIASIFGGEVDQNIAKADWQSMPQDMQKSIYQWMSTQLGAIRESRESAVSNEQAPVAPTLNRPIIEPPAIDTTQDKAELTDQSPVINIPAPKANSKAVTYTLDNFKEDVNSNYDNPQELRQAQLRAQKAGIPDPTILKFIHEALVKAVGWETPSDNSVQATSASNATSTESADTIYVSKPAARAAVKRQKLDPKSVQVTKVDGGYTINAVTTAPTNADTGSDVTIGKDGQAKWFGSQDKAQAFIDKKGISDTHEVVSAGKSRFEIQPKAKDIPQDDVVKSEAVAASPMKLPQSPVVKAETVAEKPRKTAKESVLTVEPDDVKWRDTYAGTQSIVKKLIKKGYLNQSEVDNTSGTHSAQIELAVKGIKAERAANNINTGYTANKQSQNDVTEIAPETKNRFADNKLFTEDKVAAARARLKSKLTQVNSGLDPEILIDGMTLAGAYIESGVRKFGDYAKMMMEDVGVEVKPYLLSFWEGTRHYPGLDTTGMTSPEESKIEFDKLSATIDNTDNQQDNNNDTRTSNQDDRPSADAGLPTADQTDAEQQDAGAVQAEPTSDVPNIDGRGARSDTNPSNEGGRSTRADQRTDADDSNSGADRTQSNDGAAKKTNQTVSPATSNHVISSDQAQSKLSWHKVAERNVSIIELVKVLDSENRQATKDEQALLAQYAGWGASEVANGIFPNPDTGAYKSDSWQALGEKLQSLLTESEYNTAKQTTQYAHYTPPVLVNGIYKALEGFGFKGGQILEPASGVGVFNGLMPRNLADASTYVGLELDPITGRIAQHLYPESSMQIADYIKAKLPDNHFDVAIGNPPFAGITVPYRSTGKNKTKQPLQLHDYFFAKTLDKLKPGGVMAFVTSKGTMDKTNSKTREYLAEQADLIGAIRLPQTAFKENAGTEVVTDIIFLRKRLEGEQLSDTAWTQTKSIDAKGKPATINEYFVNNPDMVLGEHAITSGRFGDTYTVLPAKGDFGKQVNDAIAKLPKNIFNPSRGSQAESIKVMGLDYDAASAANKEGGVYLKDGQLMRVVDGVGKPLTQRYGTTDKPIDLKPKDISFLTDYVGVRDALKTAQRDQLIDSESWEDSLAKLNDTYDAFVKKHGPLMAHTVSERENDDGTTTVTKRFKNKQRLFLDVEGVLASALENVVDDGKGTVVKGSFFTGRSLRKPKAPTINTVQDALIYALDETGVLDIDRIASLTNKTNEEVIEYLGEQVYNDPQSSKWDLAESYLSGNVVEKLAQAKAAAKTNKAYSRNIKALEDVQPALIAPNDISSNMGAAWIPGKVINQFSQQVLKADIDADYSKAVGLWDVGGQSKSSDYATADRTTVQLVESILNSRKISITRKSADGSTYTDSVATELANEVARKIKTEFKTWLWSDETRTNELAEYYNTTYNNIVPPTFDGDHLTLAGMSNKIQLRSPQKRGIYRVIRQGDVYLNHAVGAGKTFTMIAAAMEEKRLGLINKPMFVVPNHMLDQFSQEFLMLYPAANIMVADEQNFNGNNRKQFVAQAALNTPDAIIITHSGFERIGVSPSIKEKFLQDKLDSWKESLESTKGNKDDNRTSVKQMERNIESITRRLDETLEAKEKDGAVFFEELGVDKLYIDEAHEFRKLDFATKMGQIKGIDPSGSQRAMDLDMKLHLLRQKNPTRAFVGASGTPVTNTMGELYTIQRYFQPQQLENDGLHHFDSWANQFGEVVEGLEQNAAGNYEVIPRFAKFVNVPELMSRVRSFMDVLTSQDLGDFVARPNVRTGGREIVAIPTPDGFSDYQASLAARIDAIRKRSGKPEKGDDIILSVIGDGRFSAIDMRFVDPALPSDPNSKLNTVIRDMAEAYHATADNSYMTDGKTDELSGGALMMFTDIGLGEQSAASRGFNMKEWINSELIRLGVKPEDIAFMRDNKTHAKKGKLFDDMRQGRKRIMIGGKDMETGVNAQKRLTHLFHLDAPWFPASVEQREGRIIRQGNQNAEVVIRAYATKGSYDSTMWSMVARKARFIEQAMRGDATVRSMDDVSEASAFEQASALSSGDPRAIQLAGLRQDVERLNRQFSGFQNEKFGNQDQAKRARQNLARAERELGDINKLLPSHKDIETGGVLGVVAGKSFDNRAEFGRAILAEFNKRADKLEEGSHVLGTASGYNITYNGVVPRNGSFYADVDIDIPKSATEVLFDTTTAKDVRPDGLTTRIVNRVNDLKGRSGVVTKLIASYATDVENYERRASKSFDSQAELTEKSQELKALEDELAAEAEQLKATNNPNGLTDADRVPAKDEQPKYSKTKPAKGNTNTTPKQVIDVLQKHFGKEVVAKLVKAGKLRVRTLNDFVNTDGELLIPNDVEGMHYDGKVTLIADNLTDDTIVATLLHEMGGHAGMQAMMSPSAYTNLMTGFDNLVKAGNKYAVAAKKRAEATTSSDSEARDEYLPYLITEYTQATETSGAIGVVKRFVARITAAVRSWASKNTGLNLKINPNDIQQLAEKMVRDIAKRDSPKPNSLEIKGVENTNRQFSQVDVPAKQLAEVRKQYEGTDEWMKAPNGSDTNLNEQQWLQVRTPAFKEWFGDWEGSPDTASKVVDGNGEPMVVYHGTKSEWTDYNFDYKGTGAWGNVSAANAQNEIYLTTSKDHAEQYGSTIEFFANIKSPNAGDAIGDLDFWMNSEFSEQYDNIQEMIDEEYDGDTYQAYDADSEFLKLSSAALKNNQDGVIVDFENIKQDNSFKLGKVWIAFNPNQIKSATDNAGTFDNSNPDIRFSRRYSTLGTDGKPVTVKERARDRVALAQAATMSSKFGVNLLLRRHLATPQHIALLNPIFKVFTDNVQARIAYENNEAGLVQAYLPEIWDTRLVVGKKKKAMERVSKAIFDGTMADKVWSDGELQTTFNLTPQDISFYRRARQAIDNSVLNMTVDTLSSLAKGTKLVSLPTAQRLKLAGLTPIDHNLALQKHMTDELERLAKGGLITPKAEARMQKQLDAVFDVMGAVAGKYDKLVEDGYAPLMRFGHYAVEVRDKASNNLDLFELYETKGQQRKAIKELKERYDETKFTVGTGTLNPEGFKQFKNKGLSPETVQLFAAELGLDDDGAMQAYLKIAVSDRSALKRLIHRKKVPGYSEDMPRVLSSFVMSNARYSGRSLYNSEIERSIQDIKDGNLQNEAQKIFENMENPQEEFAQQRSMMFHYFMGFSPAFLFLNLTQPFTQTIPKLTAYVGARKGHAYMAQALAIVGKNMGASAINMGKKVAGLPTANWTGFENNLPAWVKRDDYLRMAREGHLDPQNIYMIRGLERGKGGVASGVWGNIESAAGWFAEVSESINRRSTMIAAFRVAKDMGAAKLKAKGFDNEYDFAASVIQQTQGIYNKANRSGLARGNGKLGQYGPLILVFKQFTINYTEQMIRHGRDKEVKSLAVAMMWQFALAGMLGLPFADDLRDIFEGIAYRVFGKAFNLPDYLQELLGKSNADALMYGIASEKGRVDFFGRSSLGNIIPGTDIARPGPTDWAEILGASSGFYESFFSAAAMAADGHYKDALITASPRYIRDAASAAEIAMTGSYRNTKGDKIMDLDKIDAIIKLMAFNPANNAKPGRDRSEGYKMKNILSTKSDYFSKHLAEAIYQEDDERIDKLYDEMNEWNDRNAEHFNVDIDKIEESAEKRVERKDFGSAERQNLPDSLAERQEDLAGT